MASNTLLPPTVNPDKVVTITRVNLQDPKDSGRATLKKTWHSFLEQIMLNGLSKTISPTSMRGKLVEPQQPDYSDVVVPDEVSLTFDVFPQIQSKVNIDAPLAQILTAAGPGFQKFEMAANIAATVANYAAGGGGEGSTSAYFAPYMINIPAYKPTDPPPFAWSQTFSFRLGQFGLWNAKKEVVLPILNLAAPTILRYLNPMFMQGPFPSVADLIPKILIGLLKKTADSFRTDENGNPIEGSFRDFGSDVANDVSETWDNKTNVVGGLVQSAEAALTDLANLLENLILGAYDGFMYDISYGRFLTMHSVLITGSTIKWDTNEVDQYGYPIAGSISLDFVGIPPVSLASSSPQNNALNYSVHNTSRIWEKNQNNR